MSRFHHSHKNRAALSGARALWRRFGAAPPGWARCLLVESPELWESSPMKTMKAIQISRAGGPFELVERPLPEPGPREVRVRVEACGVCHSDASAKHGGFPGQIYPVVPGHEIAGVIE